MAEELTNAIARIQAAFDEKGEYSLRFGEAMELTGLPEQIIDIFYDSDSVCVEYLWVAEKVLAHLRLRTQERAAQQALL